LAREQEHDRRIPPLGRSLRGPTGIEAHKSSGGVAGVGRDDVPSVRERATTCVQCVRHVRNAHVRMIAEEHAEVGGGRLERALRARREQEELPRAGGRRRRLNGSLLDDDVSIRPSDAERADTGSAWRGAAWPWCSCRDDVKRALRKIDVGTRFPKVNCRGDELVLQGEDGLDEPRHARRGREVSEVALDGPNATKSAVLGLFSEGQGKRLDLDGIA